MTDLKPCKRCGTAKVANRMFSMHTGEHIEYRCSVCAEDGKRVRKLRIAARLTWADLMEPTGLTVVQMSGFERGIDTLTAVEADHYERTVKEAVAERDAF